MAENIELEAERQAEINALDARVETANFFELLGVPVGAGADEVRAAFREASRKFHPDRFYGKNLGPYRAKLDRIFRKLVEANQTLTDPTRREAYFTANPSLNARAGQRPAQVKTADEEARDAERRARLARHPYLAKVTRMQEQLTRARELVAKQDYSQAFSVLNAASQLDPQNAEVKTLLADVRKKADLVRAESNYKHALEALERQDLNLALQALRTAVSANPLHAKAAHKAAQLLEKAGDAKEATSYATKAVEAAPTEVEYRLHLGDLLMEAGMKALARKHFDEALKLNPSHPEVKKRGKRLWPF